MNADFRSPAHPWNIWVTLFVPRKKKEGKKIVINEKKDKVEDSWKIIDATHKNYRKYMAAEIPGGFIGAYVKLFKLHQEYIWPDEVDTIIG